MHINSTIAWALVATLAVAVVALTINFQLAAMVGLFIVLGFWTWQQPVAALTFLIVVAPLLPMFKITQTIGTVTLIKDVVIVLLFLKLCALPLLTKKLPYRPNILFAPLIVLVGWVVVNMLQADSLVLGILRARDIGLYALLYFAVLYLPRESTWYKDVLRWFFISVVIVGALGWYQLYILPESTVLRFDPLRQVWIPRVSSVMAHPSILGQYLVTASTLALALILGTRGRTRLVPALVFLFLLPLVYFTYSRAVWLGYAAGFSMLLLCYFWNKVRQAHRFHLPWKALLLAGATICVVGLVVLQFSSLGVFLRSAFDPTYASNAERLEFLARLVAPLTPVQALLGAGLGDVTLQNFRQITVTTFDVTSGASRAVQLAKDATLVDNQYLKTFVEMGLAGLLIYAWLYWRFLKGSWRAGSQVTGLWGVGFLVAFLLQAFFIDIWDIFPTNMVFWIVAALVSREQAPYNKHYGKG